MASKLGVIFIIFIFNIFSPLDLDTFPLTDFDEILYAHPYCGSLWAVLNFFLKIPVGDPPHPPKKITIQNSHKKIAIFLPKF